MYKIYIKISKNYLFLKKRKYNKITVLFRLQALGRTAPQYTMRWRSQTVIANTRKSGPSPPPNGHAVNFSSKADPREMTFLIFVMFTILFACSFDC